MQLLLKLSRAIDALNTLIGKLTMWLVLAAVSSVLMRGLLLVRRGGR